MGFVSDYNLYQVGSGASVATWSGASIARLSDFKAAVAQDLNSIAADPEFVNPAAHDYSLQPGSPGIDRGDPTAPYFIEPATATTGNGDRLNIGAAGGTASANASPAQLIQLVGQTGGQRFQSGQTSTISFRSAGLAALDPVLYINAAGGEIVGPQPGNVWQSAEYNVESGNVYGTSTPIDPNGAAVPQSVLQSMIYFNSNVAPYTRYQIPLPDGHYRVTLTFADTYPGETAGHNVFDVLANGATVASHFDPIAVAGAPYKATQLTFDVDAAAGAGFALGMKAIAGQPLINGIQISRVVAPASTWTAKAQVSYDGGANDDWITLASGISLDMFGSGAFAFNPTQATSNGLLRIVATNGVSTVTDISVAPFQSVGQTHDYYVATAANGGDDSHAGTSAGAAMASLSTLLNVYKLQAGDVVHVGPGTFTLPTSITLGASASGAAGNPIVIEGAGASTVFQVPNTGAGTPPPIFTIRGGHDITIENMTLKGGGDGVYVAANTGAVNVTLQGLDVSGFTSEGVVVGAGATGFRIAGSNIHDGASSGTYGLDIDYANQASVTQNTFTNQYRGVTLSNVLSLDLSSNTFTNDATGVYAYYETTTAGPITVENNSVSGGSDTGMLLNFSSAPNLTVSGNTISGVTRTGLSVAGAGLVTGNTLNHNGIGLDISSGASGDWEYHHQQHAIWRLCRKRLYGRAQHDQRQRHRGGRRRAWR